MDTTQIVRCRDNDGGRPGGCHQTAAEQIVLVHPDGTETNHGCYCRYHAGNRRFWSAKPGDRVEHRDPRTGAVIRTYGLVSK